MNKRVTVSARWYGSVPHRNGESLPKNQWARSGRKRKWTVRWYAPDGKRPRQTFDTRTEAEAFAREKAAEFESRGPQAWYRPRCIQTTDCQAHCRSTYSKHKRPKDFLPLPLVASAPFNVS